MQSICALKIQLLIIDFCHASAILIWDFCLSVHHVVVLCLFMSILHQTLIRAFTNEMNIIPCFESHQRSKFPRPRPPSTGVLKSNQEVGKLAVLDWCRCLSRKRYDIGPQLLMISITISITNRKSQVPAQTVSRSTTLKGRPEGLFGRIYYSCLHHLANSKQIRHGRPSTEQACFWVNLASAMGHQHHRNFRGGGGGEPWAKQICDLTAYAHRLT